MTDPYNGMTLKDIRAFVKEACGITLSVSALSRFGQRDEIQRIRNINEDVTRELAQVRAMLEKNCPADVSLMIMGLIQDGLMRRIQEGREEMFDLSIKDTLNLSMKAARTMTHMYQYRDQHMERVEIDGAQLEKERTEWLRGVLRNNPGLLKEIMEESVNGNEQVVCAAGDDGDGGGMPPESGESRA